MTADKLWHGNGGKVILELHGSNLVKFERARDRLRIMGGMGHGLDESMLQEAISLGANMMFINEDHRSFVWQANLQEVLAKSRIRTIGNIRRRCFDLRHFDLVEGIAPAWYPKRNLETSETQAEQLSLFAGASS